MKTKMKYSSIKSFQPAVSAVTPALSPSLPSVVMETSTGPEIDPQNGNTGTGATAAFVLGAFITTAIIVIPLFHHCCTKKY